jgi:hypothetical protein
MWGGEEEGLRKPEIQFYSIPLLTSVSYEFLREEKLQVADSANYCSVQWSGKSLCVRSEYKITLMCT